MNSTAVGIKEFSTQMVTDLYCKIDESAGSGCYPKNHDLWDPFFKVLKMTHGKEIQGILILCYKKPTAPDAVGEDTYAMMLISKDTANLSESFSSHKGRRIVEYIEL